MIFDHHKSSYESISEGLKNDEDLKNYVTDKYCFDNDECGASLAWKLYTNDQSMLLIFDLIQQRDTWTFKSKEDEIKAQGLYSCVKMNDYDHFTTLTNQLPEYFKQIGEIIIDDMKWKNTRNYESGANCIIEGMRCYVLNTTENISDLGNFVCGIKKEEVVKDADGNVIYQNEKYLTDIALIWRHSYRTKKYYVSLRSNKDRDIDTTIISSKYGGGGHKCASGFTIDDIKELID